MAPPCVPRRDFDAARWDAACDSDEDIAPGVDSDDDEALCAEPAPRADRAAFFAAQRAADAEAEAAAWSRRASQQSSASAVGTGAVAAVTDEVTRSSRMAARALRLHLDDLAEEHSSAGDAAGADDADNDTRPPVSAEERLAAVARLREAGFVRDDHPLPSTAERLERSGVRTRTRPPTAKECCRESPGWLERLRSGLHRLLTAD